MTLLQLPQEYSKVQIPHETCQQAPESAPAPPGIQGGTDTPEICQQVLDSTPAVLGMQGGIATLCNLGAGTTTPSVLGEQRIPDIP